jgi:hypothetical protein
VPPLAVLCGWLAALAVAGVAARRRGAIQAWIVAGLVLALTGYRLTAWHVLRQRPAVRVASAEWRRVGDAVGRLAKGTKFLLVGDARLSSVDPTALDWRLAGELGLLDPSRAGALGEVGRGSEALRFLRRLERRGLALPAAERAVSRSVASDRSRSLYVAPSAGDPFHDSLSATDALLAKLNVDDYQTIILVTDPATPRAVPLSSLLTLRGFVRVDRIGVAGVFVERFERA